MEKKPADTDFGERFGDYVSRFHDELDPTDTITPLVQKLGGLLETIFGKERTDRGMKEILEPIASSDTPWRECLWTDYYAEFPFTEMLADVVAYAVYGADLNAGEHETEESVERKLADKITAASEFLQDCPLELWFGEDRTLQLEEAIIKAQGRWNLDQGKPIDMRALALLGGVSIGHMRNMTSGKNAALNSASGMIPAHEALKWLDGRDTFYPSIWRTARPSPDPDDEYSGDYLVSLEDPVFVPEARDGTVFHPGLKRSGHYTVGAKGDEKRFEKFEDALDALSRMPTPRWRQPGKGKSPSWSLVTGVSWKRCTMSELNSIARSMEAMKSALDS